MAFPAIREISIWVVDKDHRSDITFSMFSKGGAGAGGSGDGQNNNNSSPGKQSNEGGTTDPNRP